MPILFSGEEPDLRHIKIVALILAAKEYLENKNACLEMQFDVGYLLAVSSCSLGIPFHSVLLNAWDNSTAYYRQEAIKVPVVQHVPQF